MEQRLIHFDMDAFYASVEVLDDPTLKGLAVIVGGSGPRSVVCACSYEARKFGVRSAMPMRMAMERCPEAVRIKPHMDRYREISAGIFEYLLSLTPLVEKMSVDEGYLDITDDVASDAEAMALGERIQSEIGNRFGLACSVGVAPCKFIAKIASDLRKPHALVLVRQEEVLDFLSPLDVGRIPGVGQVGRKKLHCLGVETIGQLREHSREMLESMFGKWGKRLYDYARGIDPRPVVTEHERKSLGTEKTFDTDVASLEILYETMARQVEKIAAWLQRDGMAVETVTVKVRYANFEQVTRQQSYSRPVRTASEIMAVAQDLLIRTEAPQRPVRLIGVTVSHFSESKDTQDELPLFQ